MSLLLAVGTDPVFGLTPGQFIFGLVVVVICLAVLFWIGRQLGILK